MKSNLKVGTVGNFSHHQCLCTEGIQWIRNEWINNWVCKWWLQHCRPPRVINRLKQGGLSESLPGLLSIPRVCIIVIGSLQGHPFRAEALWIFFNQNSSILVSFQAQSKPEIRQLQVMSLGSLRSGTLRDGTVSSMLCLRIVFSLIGAVTARCWAVTWKNMGKRERRSLYAGVYKVLNFISN